MHTLKCLREKCAQPPTLDVTIVYPGNTSRVSYCVDCIGERVEQQIKIGGAVSIAIMVIPQ